MDIAGIYYEDAIWEERALTLAQRLGCPVLREAPTEELYLKLTDGGLSLEKGKLSVTGNFREMIPRLKPENLRGEFLVKASKIKCDRGQPVALDATAGMGEDAFLLAAAGYRVELYEYDAVIAVLLEDALERGKKDEGIGLIVRRMHLHRENSIEAMKRLDYRPDLILLDPMFPKRQKSGLIKKKFQLLQLLEAPCCDETELLDAAVTAHPGRILIKRPLKGPALGGKKPSYSLEGKAIRYDCIVFPEETKNCRR